MADRYRRLRFLGWWLVPTGLLTLFIPVWSAPLIEAIIYRHPVEEPIPLLWRKLDPALGSGLVFLLPCFVLATLSPYMIRLAAQQLAHVGRISGLVFAASTVGSVVGVVLSGYVLIDHMKLSTIFQVTGGLIVCLGGACFILDPLFTSPKSAGSTSK